MIQKTEWEVYRQINLNWTDAEKRDISAYQVGERGAVQPERERVPLG